MISKSDYSSCSQSDSEKKYRCRYCDKYYTQQYSLMEAGHSRAPHEPQCRTCNNLWIDLGEWTPDMVNTVGKQRRRRSRNYWRSQEKQSEGNVIQQSEIGHQEEGINGADIVTEAAIQLTDVTKKQGTMDCSSGQKESKMTEGEKIKRFQEVYHRLEAITAGIDDRLEKAIRQEDQKDYLTGLLQKVQKPRVLPMLTDKYILPVFAGASIPDKVLAKWKIEGGLTDKQLNMIVEDLTGKSGQAYKVADTVKSYVDFTEIGPEPGQELMLKNKKVLRYIIIKSNNKY